MVYLILPYCRKYCSLVGQDPPLYVDNNILAVLVLLLVFGITECCSQCVVAVAPNLARIDNIPFENILFYNLMCKRYFLQLDISPFSPL
jgi:hypothetical protein